MDVILKEGVLYLQGVNFFKQTTWRKMWMVLFKPNFSGVSRLELHTLHNKSMGYGKKKAEKLVVRLNDCLSATSASDESCPPGCTAFYLNTTANNYTLASTCTHQWLSAIWLLAFQKDPGEQDKGGFEGGNDSTMEANDLYASWKKGPTLPPNQYSVTVRTTEASLRCQLAGEYLVSTENKALLLLEINSSSIIYEWPYICIRKFGQVKGGFSIEAGRRCESGEGVFIFLSEHGPQIYETMRNNCSLERRSCTEPSGGHADQSSVDVQAPSRRFTGPPAYSPVKGSDNTKVDYESQYASVTFTAKQLSLVKSYSTQSMEALEWKGEEEDELCHSLGAVNLDSSGEDNIYHNWRKAKCPKPYPRSVSSTPPMPRYQHRENDCKQPDYGAQAWVMDGMNETVSSSICAQPKEAPGCLKNKLAKILFKGKAQHQSPPLSAHSATDSQ